MGKPWEISSDDIAEWSERYAAAGKLPELVRRLLHATVPLQALEMRADGGVRLGGWDGLAVARTERLFCPRGSSGWELTVRVDKGKLDDDFDARSKEPAPLLPRAAAYVAVSARRYANKITWVEAKKALGIWADVRLLDADDLAAWLEQAPAVARWFAREIGRPVEGFTDIDTFLEGWSRRTAPYLPAAVAIAGRDKEAAALRGWLERPVGAPLVLRGDTRDEALVFAAAAIAGSPSPAADRGRARALVVDSLDTFRWALTAQQTEPLILLPRFEGLEAGEAAGKAYVIVPVDARASARLSTGIELDRIPRPDLAAALIAGGIDPQEAETLARESGGKLGVLQRLCGHTMLPEWAESAPRGPLVAMLFAGAWEEKNPADREVIASLGAKPEEVEGLCTDLLRKPDAPIVRKDAAWAWAAPEDVWRILASELTEAQLTTFAEVAIDILGAPIPRNEAPEEDELAAFFLSATQPQSSPLRQGLAASVVRLAMSDPDFKAVHRVPRGGRMAENIVWRLLSPEWTAWVSANDVLPILAEAAPEGFLKALERSLDLGATGVGQMFAEKEAGNISSLGLLGALEILAWNPLLTSRVIDGLARLADRGADSEPAEQPIATLMSILHPIVPQSSLGVPDKLRIYERILRERIPISWKLGLRLLHSFDRGMMMMSRRPSFLSWELPPQDKAATSPEITQFQDGLIGILIEHADKTASHWRELVKSLSFIHPRNCIRVLDRLGMESGHLVESRSLIWAELRDALHAFHQPRKEGNVDAVVISRTQALYSMFAPEAFVDLNAWLFELAPRLPEPVKGGWDAEELRRDELRGEALEALWKLQDPWASLADLTKAVKVPYQIGRVLAMSPSADDVEEKLLREAPGSTYEPIIPAFFEKRFETRGLEWLDGILRALLAQGRAGLVAPILANVKPSPSLWDTVETVGDPVREAYWSHIRRVYGDLKAPEWERAAENLIRVGRVVTAVATASDSAGKISTKTVLKLLDLLGRTHRSDEILDFARSGMAAHHLDRLLARLDDDSTVDPKAIAELEGALLPFLDGSVRSVRRLWTALESGPDFFAKLVRTLYPSRDGSVTDKEVGVQERQTAGRAAYQILARWDSFPGNGLPAEEQEAHIFEWATKALELTRTDGREAGGVIEVARVLARPEAAADGAWPCLAARRLLQEGSHTGLNDALRMAKMNLRGVVSKQLGEGGDQERGMAAQFRAWAENLQMEWPKTATLLRELGQHYEEEAIDEDHEAREDQLIYGKPTPTPPSASEAQIRVEPRLITPPAAPIPLTREMQVTLVIENYRALRRVRWTLPRGVSALIGPNGSGKTTLLDVPEFLRHAIEHDVRTAVDERGGPGNLRSFQADRGAPVVVGVELDSLTWQIDLSPKGAAFNALYGEKATVAGALAFDRSTPVPGLDVRTYDARPLLPRFSELTAGAALRPLVALLKGYRLYGTYDLMNIRMNGSQVSSDEHLHPDGRNIFSVLRNWRDRKETRPRWEFVLTALKEGFPDTFDDLDFDMAGQTVSGRIVAPQPDVSFSTYFAANGWLIALLHLAAVASTEPAGAVAIDEVENGLHPYAIRALIDAMRRWAEQTGISIVLATHSPVVLDQFKEEPDHLFVMESGREPLPIRLDEMHDPEWLAHFSLGDLYAHDEFGAQHKDSQRVA